MKRPTSSESPATYAEEDIPDNPPFIIENNDKSLSYVPDQVAEDLVNNLITFLNTCDQQKISCRVENNNTGRQPKHPHPGPEITDEANNNLWIYLLTPG